ncbi:hypothetical protein G9A89_020785 [Geosiphon pyriformis]|nr:hypothetical protein G9A89_020785 [Geosiphon pyriformis]
MLQNDSEKAYIIEPNKKIAQAIFLSLVKIIQLVSIENRKELRITAKEIQGFRSMSRIDVPVNMAEKEVIDKKKIISTCQLISIPPYDQHIIVQLFETEATLCESGEIRLVNLHIPAKNHRHIKISIYNNTENIIKIPEKPSLAI